MSAERTDPYDACRAACGLRPGARDRHPVYDHRRARAVVLAHRADELRTTLLTLAVVTLALAATLGAAFGAGLMAA